MRENDFIPFTFSPVFNNYVSLGNCNISLNGTQFEHSLLLQILNMPPGDTYPSRNYISSYVHVFPHYMVTEINLSLL